MPPLWARAVLQQQAVRPLRLTILLDAGSLRSVSPHPPGAGGGEPRSELVDQGLSLPASEQLAQLLGGPRSPDPLACRVKDRTFSSPQVARHLAQTSLPLGARQTDGRTWLALLKVLNRYSGSIGLRSLRDFPSWYAYLREHS